MIRPCKRCGGIKPPRDHYCDPCKILVHAETEERKRAARRTPCKRCGGIKDGGTRGAKYCFACHEAMKPIWRQEESERSSRKAYRKRRDEGVEIRPKSEEFPDGTKICTYCGQRKKMDNFRPKSKKEPSKLSPHCKPCMSAGMFAARLKRSFGISEAQYQMMLESQDECCAICLRRPKRQRLAVDHNHKTGEIRGLLCVGCNHRLLGAAHESSVILRRAADYLDDPPSRGMFDVEGGVSCMG